MVPYVKNYYHNKNKTNTYQIRNKICRHAFGIEQCNKNYNEKIIFNAQLAVNHQKFNVFG